MKCRKCKGYRRLDFRILDRMNRIYRMKEILNRVAVQPSPQPSPSGLTYAHMSDNTLKSIPQRDLMPVRIMGILPMPSPPMGKMPMLLFFTLQVILRDGPGLLLRMMFCVSTVIRQQAVAPLSETRDISGKIES